jgi:hypothetical protein
MKDDHLYISLGLETQSVFNQDQAHGVMFL